jgi:hypothetical protein
MDGRSWKPLLLQGSSDLPVSTAGALAAADTATAWTRDVALVEYQSIAQKGTSTGRHPVDGDNNTFIALRIINSTHDLLYAEFTDVKFAANWDFADGTINFHELYNITEDYYQLNNIYKQADEGFKHALHTQLHTAFHCSGQASCP